MKNSKTKKILSILLAVVMVVGVLPITAFAVAPSEPTNLRWDGTTAKWDSVAGAVKYAVVLNPVGGGSIFAHDGTTETQYTGFAEYMFPGMQYEFGVMAYNVDGEVSGNGNYTWSEAYTMPGETLEITNIKWDRYTLTWDDIPGASGYWVALDKMGETSFQVATKHPSVNSCDLKYSLAKGGAGDYKVRISAYYENLNNTMAYGTLGPVTFNDVPIFIDKIEITDVIAPKCGAPVNVVPTCTLPSDVNYILQSAKWVDDGGKDLENGATFKPNEDYYVEFVLVPKDGCIFAHTDTLSATINGEAATIYSNDDGTIKVRIKLTSQTTEITTITIGNLAAPVAGQTPTTPTFSYFTEPYTVEFVEWQYNGSAVTGTFMGGLEYRPVFKVTPKVGYTFASSVNVMINEKDGYNVYQGADYWIVTIDMRAEAEGTLTSVAVTLSEEEGATLDDAAISVPSNVGYELDSLDDIKVNGTFLSSAILKNGDEVEVYFSVQTTDLRDFPESVIVTVNGNPATVTAHNGTWLEISYAFNVGNLNHDVSNVNINLPEEEGATLDDAAMSVPSDVIYKLSGIDKVIVNGNWYSSAILQNGDEVELIFYIQTINNKVFPNDVVVTVNGNPATVTAHNGTGLKISYAFNVGNLNHDVSNVNINLPEEPGKVLSLDTITVSSDVIYKVDEIRNLWVNGNICDKATLNDGDEINIEFSISTINSKEFPEDVIVKVNGNPATVTAHNGTWLKISYAFTVVFRPIAPTANVADGTKFATDDMPVTITCEDTDAEIYVGLYGNDPRLEASSYRWKWTNGDTLYMGRNYETSLSSFDGYTSKGKDVSLKIASVKDGVWSDVVTYTYHKIGSGEITAPTATPGSCSFVYGNSIKVSLKSDVKGAVIMYSRDGGETSYTYTSPLTVSKTTELTVWTVSAFTIGKNYLSSKVTYNYTEKPGVGGTITTFLDNSDAVTTIELWNTDNTQLMYSITETGKNPTYSIPVTEYGTYNLVVTTVGHVPYYKTINLDADSTVQDVELQLYADTNLDGVIDVEDYQALINAVLSDDHEQIETEEYDDLIHYDLVMDGYLDVLDAAFMALVVNGHKTIDEVYDLQKGDYDYDGEAYTESDLIAMYHVLSDIDSSAPTLSTSQKFASDLNYNGKVDEGDLAILTGRYGTIEETTCEENIKVYYRWGNSYTTCTATAICTICDKHVAKETVNSVKNADGSYTATFTNILLGTKTFKKQ